MLWGGWAYYVNQKSGTDVGFRSAITQGTASFIITLIMVWIVSWWFSRIRQPALRVLLPGVFTVGLTGTCLFIVHKIVGTPAVLQTITPALSVAFLFCLYTSIKLNRIEPKKGPSNEQRR